MSCAKILDKVYEYSGGERNEMPLLAQIQVGLHLLLCPDCAQEVERFEVCRDLFRGDFMPPSPGLEDAVMAMVAVEQGDVLDDREAEVAGGFSTRGWVIAGLVMLVSLATAFFGLDFNRVALAAGMSFLIPVGITIGMALTIYGALFIGSHLKELTERFGL
ncbi:MAG: peptidoglycan-binding protein [Treponema sp.]|jgi:hypothetical protein|nr:peptidoglycan-binding protein [Treponema sp.]